MITWKQFDFHLGVRYDYDDFFKNHNIAPRLSMGYDVFNDGNTLLTAGLNRYYDAGLLGYKIKEQQKFAYREYRPIQSGYLQAWLPSSYTGNFRYIFDDVKSPYDDEIALGLRHATESFGNFAVKYVHRDKKDQLSRNEETNLKTMVINILLFIIMVLAKANVTHCLGMQNLATIQYGPMHLIAKIVKAIVTTLQHPTTPLLSHWFTMRVSS